MTKKRKTRREKMDSDKRQGISIQTHSNHTISLNTLQMSTSQQQTHTFYNNTLNGKDYTYVLHDLRKTGVITFFLLAIQFVLFFLVQRNLISIKF